MRIYVDSVILIYYYDHTGSFNIRATNRVNALTAAEDEIVVSDLVRLECRVKPCRNGDPGSLVGGGDPGTSGSAPRLWRMLSRVRSPR